MQINWTGDAIADLTEIRQYIAQDNPGTANHAAVRILEAIELLKEQPGMGRRGRVHGTRELVIPGLPFIIPYRVINNSLQILRVFHAARKWGG